MPVLKPSSFRRRSSSTSGAVPWTIWRPSSPTSGSPHPASSPSRSAAVPAWPCASGSPRRCPAPTGTRSPTARSTRPSSSPTTSRATGTTRWSAWAAARSSTWRSTPRRASACRWSRSRRTSRTTVSARRSRPWTTTTDGVRTASPPRSPSSSTWTSSVRRPPAMCAPASATRSPTSRAWRTGNSPTRSTARRSTDSPRPWPGRPARPCCATPAGSATTPS